MLMNQMPPYLHTEDHSMIIVIAVTPKVSKMSLFSLFHILSHCHWHLLFCW